jgi:hypothetical protein
MISCPNNSNSPSAGTIRMSNDLLEIKTAGHYTFVEYGGSFR